MNCVICQIGQTQPEHVTVTLERDGSLLLVKDVLANVCQNCGERYFDSEITDRLLALGDRAFEPGVELEVVHMKTAA